MTGLLYRTKGDKVIWTVVIFLSLVSLLAVYSATGSLAYRERGGHTEYYLLKQLTVLVMGLLIIYFAHRVNYTIYSRVAQIGFLVSIPLLMYTLAFGTALNEASRWIKLPIINLTFQTSDVAKLAIFMYVSRQLSRRQNLISDFKKGFLPIIIPVGIICILIMPANMSTALLLGASCMLLCFIGRVPVKFLAAMVAAFSAIAIAFVSIVVITGLIASWIHLGSFSALTASRYGKTLLVKLAVVVVVAAAGHFNWRHLGPALKGGEGSARLQRSAAFELAAALLVLAVTAALVATPLPPH